MKTSLILIVALLLNTSLLLAEPMLVLIKGINPWLFIGIECFLILGYLGNKFLNDFSKAMEINLGPLEIFVYKKRR